MSNLLEYAGKTQSNIIPKESFQELILEVFGTISDGVSKSLGPLGSVSTLIDGTSTSTTKDGFTIFNHIKFRNKFKCMAYGLIANPCRRLNNTVGDGTSTAIVLTKNLYETYMEQRTVLEKYYRMPRTFTKIWDEVIGDINDIVLSYATPIDESNINEIYNIAYISSNGDEEISRNLLEIYSKSKSPVITLKNSPTNKSFIKSSDGFMFPTNLTDNMYCKNDDGSVTMNNVKVLLFDRKIDSEVFNSIIKPMNEIWASSSNQLLVIAPSYDETFSKGELASYINNELYGKHSLNLIITQFSYGKTLYDEHVGDLAALLNVNVLSDSLCSTIIENVSGQTDGKVYEYLTNPINNIIGNIDEVELSIKNGSIFRQGNKPDKYNKAIEAANKALEYEINNTDYEKIEFSIEISKIKTRISQLNMENYNYYIGSDSRLQTGLLNSVIDDVIKSTRSARKNGIVPGCQLSIIKACNKYLERFVEEIFPADDVLRILIANIIKTAVRKTYLQVLEGPNGDGIVKIIDLNDIPTETLEAHIASKRNEIIDKSVSNFKVFDVDSCTFSSNIISPVETDVNVLTAASELVRLLISSNQCIYLDASTSGEEYLADIQ